MRYFAETLKFLLRNDFRNRPFSIAAGKTGDTEARDLIQFMRATRQEISADVRLDKSVFATKEDIANLRTEIKKGFKEQLKWLIILLLGFSSLIITVIKLL